MLKTTNIRGIKKIFFKLKLITYIFFYFLFEMFKFKISLQHFIALLRRLLIFLKSLNKNKFVKLGKRTKLDLYIPGFPSKAFFHSCYKFLTFNQKMPALTALVSITSACTFNCKHCYQKLDKGKDVDIGILINTVKNLQTKGITFFNLEGGEPFLVYDRLKKMCQAIDKHSEIWINSTGQGITKKRLLELKKYPLTAIMFSLHSTDPRQVNKFMGSAKAWVTMKKAIKLCYETGIAVAFNSCLLKKDFYNGNFEKIMNKAKSFNACLVQLIKPKPAGAWLEKGPENFTEQNMQRVKELVLKYNLKKEYHKYPSISAQIIEESKEMFGCTAGGTDRFYINAKGDLQPCEFLNISFGNIAKDDFNSIYNKMRTAFREPDTCWLCEKYAPEIAKLYKKHNLKSLPLDPELSKEIISKWDRGEYTPLYKKFDKIK